MDLITIFIWIFVLFGWLLYRSMSKNISHFKDRGIKYVTPVPVIGNLLNVFLKKDAYFDLLQKFYDKFYHEKYDWKLCVLLWKTNSFYALLVPYLEFMDFTTSQHQI